jgi:hypothetical protein
MSKIKLYLSYSESAAGKSDCLAPLLGRAVGLLGYDIVRSTVMGHPGKFTVGWHVFWKRRIPMEMSVYIDRAQFSKSKHGSWMFSENSWRTERDDTGRS